MLFISFDKHREVLYNMDKHSKKAFSDEPAAALRKWKAAMARFDAAAPDEAKIVALEVEAARRRYIFLLEQRRAEQ